MELEQPLCNQAINSNRVQKYNYKQKNYWKILLLVTIFYSIPSIQFVLYQIESRIEHTANISETCRFNFKCNQQVGLLYAFNNIISNILYVIFGIIYIFIVAMSKNGSIIDKNIYYSLGIAMSLEGIFSGIYHICPSSINFQFDTTYMLIGTGTLITAYHQKRIIKPIADVFRLYTIFAICIIFNTFELTHFRNETYDNMVWVFSYILYFILSSYFVSKIYFGSGTRLLSAIKDTIINRDFEPKNKELFWYLSITNTLNLVLLVISNVNRLHVSSYILGMMLLHLNILKAFYLYMKIKKNEKIPWYIWALNSCIVVIWSVSGYYYMQPTSDKFLDPVESRELNTPCVMFDYFDTHDVWHFLSAIGLFLMLLNIWVIDSNMNPSQLVRNNFLFQKKRGL